MYRLSLQTIRARKARFVLTAFAVILGVAFMCGTLVLTDTINRAYDGVAASELASTGAVVRARGAVDPADGTASTGPTRGTVSTSVLGAVRAVAGVAAADGVVDGTARLVGRDGRLVDGRVDQAVPIGMAWPTSEQLNPLRLVDGHAPHADGEVVIDRASARDGRFAPGDSVRVLTPSGSAPYTVAGVATFGSESDAGGAGVVAFTPAAAARVLGEPGRLDSIRAVAAPGISQPELAGRIRSALAASAQHPDLEVVTGRTAVVEARDAAHRGFAFMGALLLVFAVVALVVGGFVIFNTLSITVAQRTTETATLRAIGSSRGQVTRMVVIEALLMGILASAVGALLGVGLAHGLAALLGGFGVELPGGSTVVTPRTLIASTTVGTVVAVLAALLPARRAGKVSPLAAMRAAAIDTPGRSPWRAAIGALLTGAGAALVAAAPGEDAAARLVGLGALALLAGVVVLGPVVGPRFVRLVGAPVARYRGVPGALARDNAARNPKRTAATASALTIGIALVTLLSVLAASARSSIDANIDHALRSDWVITSVQPQEGLSPTVARAVAARPEVDSVTTFRAAPATLGGSAVEITGIDPATVERHLDLGVRAGGTKALGAHEIGVRQAIAAEHHWHVGDSVDLTFAETGTQRFTIAMLYRLRDPLGDYTMSDQAFDANVAHPADQAVFALDAPGVSRIRARAAIEGALQPTPSARLYTPAEFKAYVGGRIGTLLNLLYVLLLLAVLIALFGVANTLALSVMERRRELGLLRAVGMHRRQVRAGVRWEAAMIALLGTALGLALGLGLGWALVASLSSQGIDRLAVPATRLVVIALLGTVAAVAAAALPARRAARLGVLESIRA